MVLQHHGCLEPDTAQEHCAPPVCPILDAPRDRRLRPTARRFSPFRPCCGSRQVTEVVGHIMGVRKPWRRHVAPRRTPGTVQRALLDGPKGQNLSLGPKKIFLLIRWSQSTRRSLSLKGLVKKVYRAFILSVGKISAAVGLRNLSSFEFE